MKKVNWGEEMFEPQNHLLGTFIDDLINACISFYFYLGLFRWKILIYTLGLKLQNVGLCYLHHHLF